MPSLRTALALTLTAAAAVVVPAGAAAAADGTDVLPAAQSATDALPTSGLTSALPTQSVTGALGSGVAPVRDLTLDPLSHTGVDPLDNALGTQVADFQPVSTSAVTSPLTNGASLGTLPLVGPATGILPG
ncbi:hypothetical protein ABZ901_13990 [Actinacidiphila alni]|uniref:hypothetical protein n=1 Tax=Actinacidiphila alni TaxID=380248 RepID=UPI00340313B4